MAVGFSTDVTFDVSVDDDARLPYPAPAQDSDLKTYDATILLTNQAEYDLLEAYVSGITILPAMGGGGLVDVTRGRGARTLTIPLSNGGEKAYRAILTAISARPRLIEDTHLSADVSFVVLSVE